MKKEPTGHLRAIANLLEIAERPVKIKEIKKITNLSDRKIKEAVETLIFNYDLPIVSSRGKGNIGGGYYLARNRQELDEGLKSYKQQIRTSELRVKKLESLFN